MCRVAFYTTFALAYTLNILTRYARIGKLSAIEYCRILYALYLKNTPQFGVRVVISTKSTSRSAASNSHKTKPASQENVAIDGMTAKFPHQHNYHHHHHKLNSTFFPFLKPPQLGLESIQRLPDFVTSRPQMPPNLARRSSALSDSLVADVCRYCS